MDKPELHEKIKTAFSAVPYPGDENLIPVDARDEGETVVRLYAGKDRYSFKPRELWAEALFWMTPEARHYYLPAYLLAATEESCRDFVPELTYILTPKESADTSQDGGFLLLPFGHLSDIHKNAIYDFLNLIGETGGYPGAAVAELVYLQTPKEYAGGDENGGFQLLPWEPLRSAHKVGIYDFLNLIAASGPTSEDLTAGLVLRRDPQRASGRRQARGIFHPAIRTPNRWPKKRDP